MTSRREHDAQAAATAAIARATAHTTPADDWPEPIPTPAETPLHQQYPITPAGARARRLFLEETRNHG